MKQHPLRFRLRYNKTSGLLLISPWLLGLLLFKLLPIITSLGLSFTNFYLLEPAETRFIGLDNYSRFLQDEQAGRLLLATLQLALTTVPLQLIVSTLLAALLNTPALKKLTYLRTLFFLPAIIPGITFTLTWRGFLNPSTGWLSRFLLQPLGFSGPDNLLSETAVALFLTINALWSIGPGVLILFGAMQGISSEILEAARVDGANSWVRFSRITLPMISPALFFSLIINLIAIFGGVILLDRGNAVSGSSSPYDGYITYMLFDLWDLGYAATLAWIFFIIVIVAVLLLFISSRRWVYYPDQTG